MRLLAILLLLILSNITNASGTIPSYKDDRERFVEKSKSSKSSFTEHDKLIMKKARQSLADSFPEPGIKIGEKAPNFILKNAFNEEIELNTELKKGPVILVFYRGAWCPFCNMHLHVLQQSLTEFKKYGAQLITITPQTPDKSAEQIKKDHYPFQVLSDSDSKVMKDYNLYFELSDDLTDVYKKNGLDIEEFNGKGRNVLPVPGSFVIDKDGIIQAMQAKTDYRVRMEPSTIINVLKKISKKYNN